LEDGVKEVLGLLTVKLISTVSSLPYMMVSGSKFKKVFENSLIFFFSVTFQSLSGYLQVGRYKGDWNGLIWLMMGTHSMLL
jgi:hypothetical protein